MEPLEVSLFRAHARAARAGALLGYPVALLVVVAVAGAGGGGGTALASLHARFVGPLAPGPACLGPRLPLHQIRALVRANGTVVLTVTVPDAYEPGALSLLLGDSQANGTWVYSSHLGTLHLPAATARRLGVAEYAVTIPRDCYGSEALFQVIGYDVVLYNDLYRTFQGGHVVDMYGKTSNLNGIFPDYLDLTDYIIVKTLLFFGAVILQHGLKLSAMIALSFSQSQMLHSIHPRMLRVFALNLAPVVMGFFLSIFGALFTLDQLLEDKLLSLLIVSTFWFSHMFQTIYLRTSFSTALFDGVAKHSCRFLLIYCLSFSSLGFCFEMVALVALLLLSLGIGLFLLREVPAVMSGQISEVRVREHMLIRRFNVQINQEAPLQQQQAQEQPQVNDRRD